MITIWLELQYWIFMAGNCWFMFTGWLICLPDDFNFDLLWSMIKWFADRIYFIILFCLATPIYVAKLLCYMLNVLHSNYVWFQLICKMQSYYIGRLIDTARLIEALPMLIIVMLLSSCGKRISMPLAATFLVSIFFRVICTMQSY